MSAALATQRAEALEQVLVQGNLKALTPEQRTDYYRRVCESLGLNPLTKPFEYLELQGKLILYARRDCTEQLRKRDGVSVEITGRELVGDVYVVSARAKDRDGRTDESIGAVSIIGLKGEALANAMMKSETKAKRRVTLSICGLGMLDETEVANAPHVERNDEPAPAVKQLAAAPAVDPRKADYDRAAADMRTAAARSCDDLKRVYAEVYKAGPAVFGENLFGALELLKDELKAKCQQAAKPTGTPAPGAGWVAEFEQDCATALTLADCDILDAELRDRRPLLAADDEKRCDAAMKAAYGKLPTATAGK